MTTFDLKFLREKQNCELTFERYYLSKGKLSCKHAFYVSIMCDMTLPGRGSINRLRKLVSRLKVALNYELLNYKLFTRALTFES